MAYEKGVPQRVWVFDPAFTEPKLGEDDHTWCSHPHYEGNDPLDVEYVRADIHDALAAKCAELEKDREALYALKQGRVVDAFDEKNARITELEAQVKELKEENARLIQALHAEGYVMEPTVEQVPLTTGEQAVLKRALRASVEQAQEPK